jgi:hypothetical protein
MELESADVELINQIVARVHLLCKRNYIPVRKLNLDCYEFEVSEKRVHDGIGLYYTENTKRVQANSNVWYSKDLSPILTSMQNWQQKLPGYLKLQMGGKDWYREEHHLRTIGQAEPSGFFGARLVQRRIPYALFFKLPRETVVFNCNSQPIEFYAEDDRINVLFLLATQSPEPQPRNLDVSYDFLSAR